MEILLLCMFPVLRGIWGGPPKALKKQSLDATMQAAIALGSVVEALHRQRVRERCTQPPLPEESAAKGRLRNKAELAKISKHMQKLTNKYMEIKEIYGKSIKIYGIIYQTY